MRVMPHQVRLRFLSPVAELLVADLLEVVSIVGLIRWSSVAIWLP